MSRSSADRKKRYRRRQREGVRVYATPIPDRVIEQAINAGLLSDEDSHDQAKVGAVLARIAIELIEYSGTRPA